ncbi:MAG: ABC transporter permease [Halobacteriales archaeon]|nr:ABC transporter permease [Halobacteriales archaeon]
MTFDLNARAMWTMVQRNRDVYLKTWKTNFLPPLLEPLLYLLSLGYGLGVLVPQVAGTSYAQFIAPAILSITMMQSAFFDTTYGSYVRMFFQRTWDAVTATPLSLEDVLVGEMAWAALKSAINTGLMAVVVAAFGLLPWALLPLLLPLAFLVGLAFAGIGMMFSAKVPSIDAFSFAIYLLITPMMLFSGTFFPLAQLPQAFQRAALALPLTHAVLVARPVALGHPADVPWTSVAYLLAAAVVFPAIAVRWMRRKLIV